MTPSIELVLLSLHRLGGPKAAGLSTEEFDGHVRGDPHNALKHAGDFLSPEQFDHCCNLHPETAFVAHPDLMTAEQVQRHHRDYPTPALIGASHRLTPEQLQYCIRARPEQAVMWVPDKITADLIEPEEFLQFMESQAVHDNALNHLLYTTGAKRPALAKLIHLAFHEREIPEQFVFIATKAEEFLSHQI